jgi:hypothetical protein
MSRREVFITVKFVLFQGSSLDVYIHWLILALGIGILLSILAVATSCRSFATLLNLSGGGGNTRVKLYGAFARYHSYYWAVLGWVLVLHLLVTTYHLGLPVAGEPYLLAHKVAIFSAIGNLAFVAAVFSSCRSFARLFGWIMPGGPLGNKKYRLFYKYHSYFWWFLGFSIGGHIIFGMIHSVNT